MSVSIQKNQTFAKVVVGITFLITIALFYSNPDQFLSDNSLFYPVVAQNIVEHGMSSFNGYIETYGYQPLWMLVSVVSVYLSEFFSFNLLMVIGFFYQLFLVGSIVIVFKMAKRWPFFSAPVVALIFIFMFIANGVLHNMESAMALFFVLCSVYYGLKIEQVNRKNLFVFGLLLGLTILSRLDLTFFALILSSYVLTVKRKALFEVPQNILFYLLGLLVVLLPYFVHNLLAFDALLPMSDRLSHGFPTLAYAWANIYPYGAVSFVIALIEWGIAWTAKSREARVIILVMSLSTIFQVIYVAFFMHPQSWYFITGFINFALIAGYLLKRMNRAWLINVAMVGLVVVTVASSYLKTVSNYALSAHILRLKEDKVGKAALFYSEKSEKLKYAEDAKKVLPENTTVLAGHSPGALAYYAKLKVFAANGLSNGLIQNTIYDTALANNGIEATIKQYDIKYLIVPLTNGAALWYERLGFDVKKDKYEVMVYSKTEDHHCGLLQYNRNVDLLKVRLGFASTGHAGVFPTTDVVGCSEEMKDYKKSGFYSTVIGK